MPRYTKEWWTKAKQFQTPLISRVDLERMLVRCKDTQEKCALLILYYSGCRPAELMLLKWRNIMKDDGDIRLSIPTLKGGIGRTIYFQIDDVNKLLIDAKGNDPDSIITKWKNAWNIRDLVYGLSEKELTAYFFRHNRLSKLANAGVDPNTLKRFKGAKRLDSVEPYLQLAGIGMKDISKKII